MDLGIEGDRGSQRVVKLLVSYPRNGSISQLDIGCIIEVREQAIDGPVFILFLTVSVDLFKS